MLASFSSRCSRCAPCLSPHAHGAQYRSTQWTADSGLPQNSVRGIVQAADGYLWVATLDGLAKFDGIRFTVFNKSNTPGITSNRFVAMAEGDGGDLWIASEDGNLTRYHAGHFETMGEPNGLRPHSVGAITYDRHGGVWVDSDDRVYRWSPQSRALRTGGIRPGRHEIHPFVVGWNRILGDPERQSPMFRARPPHAICAAENIDSGAHSRCRRRRRTMSCGSVLRMAVWASWSTDPWSCRRGRLRPTG